MASLSRVDIPCQCPTRTSSSKWTLFSGRVPVVQGQALLTVQGTMRELACPSERISDTPLKIPFSWVVVSAKLMGDSLENSRAVFIRGGEPWLMRYCWRIYCKVLEVLLLAYVFQAFLPSKMAW